MAALISLIRHGETDWNVMQRIQGLSDTLLNARGVMQAEQIACRLSNAGLAAIYSSDLMRAHQTATIIKAAQPLPLEVFVDLGLRERRFGVFEGQTRKQLLQNFPQDMQRWEARDPDWGPIGGENNTAIYKRSQAAFKRLSLLHPNAHIALVTHGGVIDCIYRWVSGCGVLAKRNWKIPNAALNQISVENTHFHVQVWADITHYDEVIDTI